MHTLWFFFFSYVFFISQILNPGVKDMSYSPFVGEALHLMRA